MKHIMIQLAHPKWTQDALYQACNLAQAEDEAHICIVRFIPVNHPTLLGSELACQKPSAQENAVLWEAQQLCAEYDIRLTHITMQYVCLTDAVVQVSSEVSADLVFATLPKPFFGFWHDFLLWRLRSRLSAGGHTLYSLFSTDPDSAPLKAVPLIQA